jgi:glycosidase
MVFVFFLIVLDARAEAPRVLKVEPPNWWAGHSINPVRLLVRGEHLSGAEVHSSAGDFKIGLTQINDAGTYLFVDLLISPAAKPGPVPILLTTPAGSVQVPFEILDPLPRAGRFQGFSQDDIIYLLMPDRFSNGDPSNDDPQASKGLLNRANGRYYHGGDFQGVIDHLPYLKNLGVTAIWLNPFYDNVNHLNERETYDGQAITDYHGYSAVDFYGVEEHFGTLEKLKEMVEAAHRQGLKVIQDQVANHTGPYHPWVYDSPTPTWFNGTQANHLANTWQIWTLMDPHASPEMQKATLEGWFINLLPDLNQNDEEVSRYLIQNTLWWAGITGLDAIRQDTMPYVPRRFWRAWMEAIKKEYPKLNVIGETWDADPALVSFFQGGKSRFDGIDSGVDSLFDFPLAYSVRRAFAEKKSLKEPAQVLSHDHLYPSPELLVTFLGNHDMARFMNEGGATAEGLRLAFTFLMTSRGIPQIYYGDEIGMRGGNDPDNRRDFPGGWHGDPKDAFQQTGRDADEQAVFSHLQKLTKLRAELAPLRRGRLANLLVSDQVYAFSRNLDSDVVLVIINNGPQPATVEIPLGSLRLPEGAVFRDRLAVAGDFQVRGGEAAVTLPPRSGAIYTR